VRATDKWVPRPTTAPPGGSVGLAHYTSNVLVKIVSEGQTIARWFADVSADNRRLVIDLPREGMLELGYGSEVLGRVPVKFESEAMNRLDRERLPEDVIVVSTESLETKR
jgi:hypothetical protein